MATRPCARCGRPIPPDQYLCWACRQEMPVGQADEEGAARADEGSRPAEAERPPRTFRGRPVPPGMVLPSRTQYHGTIMGLIGIGILVVLLLAVFLNTGVGPFAVTNLRVQPGAPIVASGTVTNRGDHAGSARCVATWDTPQGGVQETPTVTTPSIGPGASRGVRISLPQTAGTVQHVSISCK